MRLSAVIREGFGRGSNIIRDFFRDIVNLPNVDRLIKEHSISDGHAFLLRGKDGNAYEIIIRPAAYAQYFQDERKADQHAARKQAKREKQQDPFSR
jgi:hypothetical protein